MRGRFAWFVAVVLGWSWEPWEHGGVCARGAKTAFRTKPASTPARSQLCQSDGSSMFLVSVSIVVAAVVPVFAAAVGPLLLAAVIAVEQLLLGWAWVRALGASTGTLAIVLVAAPAADVTAVMADSNEIGNLAGVVGLAVVAVILVQLARRRGWAEAAGAVPETQVSGVVKRDRGFSPGQSVTVTVDMAAGLSGVVLVTLLAGYLNVAAIQTPDGRVVGPMVVTVGLVGAATAVLVARLCVARLCAEMLVEPVGSTSIPGWARVRSSLRAGCPVVAPVVGFAAGAGAGAILGGFADDLDVWEATLIAGAAAAAAVIVYLAVARGIAEIRAEPAGGFGGRPVPGGGPVSSGRPVPSAPRGQVSCRDDHLVGWPLVATFPLAGAAAFVYTLGRLLVG
ncbi:hypothetical protein [Protofrankia symbiont of Coriaria ruscifolia]|uniref:hypothetical protein n=1 Tax=Protofrankia symbiont of Coriaria ruscifolia TaxID=1306542 RepID=UPI0010414565|nr:hypothetical protein [Protofrankia symbiont of Coriaria ruscifolia]